MPDNPTKDGVPWVIEVMETAAGKAAQDLWGDSGYWDHTFAGQTSVEDFAKKWAEEARDIFKSRLQPMARAKAGEMFEENPRTFAAAGLSLAALGAIAYVESGNEIKVGVMASDILPADWLEKSFYHSNGGSLVIKGDFGVELVVKNGKLKKWQTTVGEVEAKVSLNFSW